MVDGRSILLDTAPTDGRDPAPGVLTVLPASLDWIAADWGTSRLRLWALAADGAVLAQTTVEFDRAAPPELAPTLLSLVGEWLPSAGVVPVIACGRTDAGFRAVPCTPLAAPLVRAPTQDRRLAVWAVPGLSQPDPSADLMQGDETRIAGVLAARAGWDGVVCLPGLHSRWVELSAGEVVSFRSFMSGELLSLLAGQSALRGTIAAQHRAPGADFDAAVAETLSRPQALAARLLSLRAEAVLSGLDPATARERLSGWLIGAELAAARPWWLGRDVVVVGDAPADAYARALAGQGVQAARMGADTATLAGLAVARGLLRGNGA